MRILLLGAFQDELQATISQHITPIKETIICKRRCTLGKWGEHDLAISYTGVGTTAAAATTTALCEGFEPDLIIMCGVAGGLATGQKVGDLVLANKIIDADLINLPKLLTDTPYVSCLTDPHSLQANTFIYEVNPSLIAIAEAFPITGLSIGPIVSSNTFPAPKHLFEEIKSFAAHAIEMESIGVFKAAEYYNVPVMTIRAMSNLLNEYGDDLGTLPDALTICSARLALFLNHFISHLSASHLIAKSRQDQRIAELVSQHHLLQHPEGGWFYETYRSTDSVLVEGAGLARYDNESRSAATSILFLLSHGDYSGWHRLKSDETWLFHEGEPLLLYVIDPASHALQKIQLGGSEGVLQFTVKAGDIFCAEPQGHYSLVGCIVTPGFNFKDFELISQKTFLSQYPEHRAYARLIRDQAVECAVTEAIRLNQYTPNLFNAIKQRETMPSNSQTTPVLETMI